MLRQHEIEVRVRYKECDPMGYVHHANYFIWFEMGRTELLRASGGNYRKLEEEGTLIVVAKADCRYRKPARYDDLLRVRTTVTRVSAASIEHEYEIFRGEETLVVGHVTLAVVDRQGRIQMVPEYLHVDEA
jgi:acyl-CoA thioester hydrolase